MQIRKRLTYANVVSSFALFLVLAGGGAVAATQLGKGSVGTKQLKKDAVTAAKIKDGAVTGAKVKLDTLGTVPSAARAASAARADAAVRATTAARADAATFADAAARADLASVADTAKRLDGKTTFAVRLLFGQQQTVATNGAVSITVSCVRPQGGPDRVDLVAQTQVNGAVAGGFRDQTAFTPFDTLSVGEDNVIAQLIRNLAETFVISAARNQDQLDAGFVLGVDGKGLVLDAAGLILGLNYGGSGCLAAGVVNAIDF